MAAAAMELQSQKLADVNKPQQEGKHNKIKKKRKQKMILAEQEEHHCRLMNYSELPDYMKENEYILGYYRSGWPLGRAFLSVFSWHNETLNVWSHLLGFLLFSLLTLMHLDAVPTLSNLLLFYASPENHHTNTNFSAAAGGGGGGLIKVATLPSEISLSVTARWPFFVFLAGSMFCLSTSSMCHLFCCHSRRLNLFLARLDFAGIAIMIVASFFPPIYYIFQCDPHWQLAYLAGITAMGLFTVATLLAPQFSTGAFRSYRALLFVGMGVSGVVPAVHAVVLNWSDPRRNVTLAYELAMAGAYLTGTFFYVTRIPERWRPGWFDLAGQSHQIFHVFVMGGALAHYGAALVFLEWRDAVGCS